MAVARSVARSALPAARSLRVARQPIRLQSTAASSSSTKPTASSTPWAAGVLGGLVGAGLCFGAYSYTPSGRAASNLNKAVIEADKKYKLAAKKLQQNTPSTDEAVNYIKQLAYSYVGWIPGGRGYVDAAFKDWEKVRENHREEADKIVNDAYKQFQDVSKSGLSLDTASRAYEILADVASKVADLAGDALSDILDNHPQLKNRLGDNVDKLKQMSDQYGPEAKKKVDETWRQVKDIFAGGLSQDNLNKARKLIQEKSEEVQKLGDQAWDKAYDEAKSYLDKNPKVKELVDSNASALKKGNAKELFDKAKSAVDSGKSGDLESYVKSLANKAGSSGQDYFDKLPSLAAISSSLPLPPQLSELAPQLSKLTELAKNQPEEAKKLVQDTLDEVMKVLENSSKKAVELGEKSKKNEK